MKNNPARKRFIEKNKSGFVLIGVILVAAVVMCIVGSAVRHSNDDGIKLRISEMMLSNSVYADPNGIIGDWIEIENLSDEAVDLSGMILTDDRDTVGYVFPTGTVLESGGFKVVWCLPSAQNAKYASFGLSKSGGETVYLISSTSKDICSAVTFALDENQSMVATEKGYTVCDEPSPGFANTAEGHKAALEQSGAGEMIQSPTELVISELVAQNKSGLTDKADERHDWLEITNPGQTAVDISGFGISTSASDPFAWAVMTSTVIEPGESVVVFASGKNTVLENELHTSFRLSSSGESLYIFDTEGALVTKLSYPELSSDQAWQLGDDGEYFATYAQTPGVKGQLSADKMDVYKGKLVINELVSSYTVGFGGGFDLCSDWIEIKNVSNETIDISGFYLTDSEIRGEISLSGELKSGECAIVWADSKKSDDSSLHCDFKLSRNSETVKLCAPWGAVVDSVSYEILEENLSLARDAEGKMILCSDPTPGFANTAEGLEKYCQSLPEAAGLVINEVMHSNSTVLPQSYGECYDWIELKNLSSQEIDLSGYYLSDSRDKPGMWQLPKISLKSGECYVVLCSGDEGLTTKSYKHTSFTLDNDGDSVFLFDASSRLCDAVFAGELSVQGSRGRMDKNKGFFYFASPTPGADNRDGKRLIASSPATLTLPGAHNDVEKLSVELAGQGSIYYTLDGSAPHRGSKLYSGPILLEKSTVIRAMCVSEGMLDSESVSYSFFLNEGHSLPIVSLSLDPSDLWDYNTGIYVMGPGASSVSPYRGANFYKDWEKAGNISFYEAGKSGFSVNCGVKIFGNTGRALDKKSFQVKFKQEYGQGKLCYDLFGNTEVNLFDSLVLRSGSQDYKSSLIRDAVISELCAQGMPETEVQDYRYCVLYLNGEYWGVYCFREKLDEDFVAAKYNVEEEKVDLLGYMGAVNYGSAKEYRELVSYVKSHDLSVEANYRYVKDRVCLDSYIDWFIAQAYVGNSDLDNIRFFKTDSGDGKWRWILYDFDLTFYRNANPYSYLISSTQYYADVCTIMRALMKNGEFKDYFLKRLAMQLSTTFSEENVLSVIDGLYESIRDEMPRERERWNMSYSSWENAVETLRKFVKGKSGVTRAREIIDNVKSTMGLSDSEVNKYFGGI